MNEVLIIYVVSGAFIGMCLYLRQAMDEGDAALEKFLAGLDAKQKERDRRIDEVRNQWKKR